MWEKAEEGAKWGMRERTEYGGKWGIRDRAGKGGNVDQVEGWGGRKIGNEGQSWGGRKVGNEGEGRGGEGGPHAANQGFWDGAYRQSRVQLANQGCLTRTSLVYCLNQPWEGTDSVNQGWVSPFLP
jgi:hypothetical protein